MIRPQALFIYILMGILTFGYTMVARLGLSLFHVLYEPSQMGELPTVSRFTAQLSVIEIWQVLAWSSFVISLVWGIFRCKQNHASEPCLLPWICHLTWILLSFFGNVVGALAPFVSVAYVIK
jgi:hypothetical protein